MAAVASCVIVFASCACGAAPITLARMVTNILLEAVVGGVPVVGDLFHVFWKANREITEYCFARKERPRAKTWQDWIFLGAILLAVAVAVAAPIVVLLWLVKTTHPF